MIGPWLVGIRAGVDEDGTPIAHTFDTRKGRRSEQAVTPLGPRRGTTVHSCLQQSKTATGMGKTTGRWPSQRRSSAARGEAPMEAREPFRRNDWPTLGVEVELQLVDAETMALKSAIADLLGNLPAESHGSAKKELMQCFVEVTSDACRTVDEAGDDLTRMIGAVERAADRCGTRLHWAASHPFSHWAGPGDHAERTLRPAGRDAPGGRRPACRLRPARPRRRRVGRRGGHDLRPAPAPPPRAAGAVGQQPVLVRAEDRPPFPPHRGAGGLAHRRPAAPDAVVEGIPGDPRSPVRRRLHPVGTRTCGGTCGPTPTSGRWRSASATCRRTCRACWASRP